MFRVAVRAGFSLLLRTLRRPLAVKPPPPPPTPQFMQEARQFYDKQVRNQGFKVVADIAELSQTLSKGQPAILYCSAEWCEPCKVLQPKLQQLLKPYSNIQCLKVDVDKIPEVSQALRIQAVPTVLLISEGKVVEGFQGIPDQKKIDSFIKRVASLSQIGKQAKGRTLQAQVDQIMGMVAHKQYEKAASGLDQLQKDKEKKKQAAPILAVVRLLIYAAWGKPAEYLGQLSKLQKQFKDEIKKGSFQHDVLGMAKSKHEEKRKVALGSKEVTAARKEYQQKGTAAAHEQLMLTLKEARLLEEMLTQLTAYLKRPGFSRPFLESLIKSTEGPFWVQVRRKIQRALF